MVERSSLMQCSRLQVQTSAGSFQRFENGTRGFSALHVRGSVEKELVTCALGKGTRRDSFTWQTGVGAQQSTVMIAQPH